MVKDFPKVLHNIFDMVIIIMKLLIIIQCEITEISEQLGIKEDNVSVI